MPLLERHGDCKKNHRNCVSVPSVGLNVLVEIQTRDIWDEDLFMLHQNRCPSYSQTVMSVQS